MGLGRRLKGEFMHIDVVIARSFVERLKNKTRSSLNPSIRQSVLFLFVSRIEHTCKIAVMHMQDSKANTLREKKGLSLS